MDWRILILERFGCVLLRDFWELLKVLSPSFHSFGLWFTYKHILLVQAVIDRDDEKLKDLKNSYGNEVYDAVTSTLAEINEYNPSGRYIISELWNYTECREATLLEGVVHMMKLWRSYKRKRGMD